jgi:DNA-binding NtrC family response regulator
MAMTPANSPWQWHVMKRPNLLVVDDETAVLRMIELAMQHYGFDVTPISSSKKAVEFYRQNSGNIDLVLLDVQLREMDGPSTLAALKQINPQVRCCFMSGHTGRYSVADLRAMGALAFLPKPFLNLTEMAQRLHECVATGQ